MLFKEASARKHPAEFSRVVNVEVCGVFSEAGDEISLTGSCAELPAFWHYVTLTIGRNSVC